MKKILILLAAICCSGCSTGVAKEEPTQPLNVKYYYRDPVLHLYTAEVEGHLYIISKSAPGGMSTVPPVNPREKKLCARPRSQRDNTTAL